MVESDGAIKSITAMSLLKRVKILPIGFESKKRMFDRRTFSLIVWYMFEVTVRKMPNMAESLIKQLAEKIIIRPINIKG